MKNKLLLVLFSLFFFNCSLENSEIPFVISELKSTNISENGDFLYGGVKFDLYNNHNVAIIKFKVRFYVFANEFGENPFYGSNLIEASFEGMVLPKEKKSFEISLDGKILYPQKEPYFIDYFYLPEVLYEDNSVWEDKYGHFNVSGVINE